MTLPVFQADVAGLSCRLDGSILRPPARFLLPAHFQYHEGQADLPGHCERSRDDHRCGVAVLLTGPRPRQHDRGGGARAT